MPYPLEPMLLLQSGLLNVFNYGNLFIPISFFKKLLTRKFVFLVGFVTLPNFKKLHIPGVLIVFPSYRSYHKVCILVIFLLPIHFEKFSIFLPKFLPLVDSLKQIHFLHHLYYIKYNQLLHFRP